MTSNYQLFQSYVNTLRSIKHVKATLTKDKGGETWHLSSTLPNSLAVQLEYTNPNTAGLAPADAIFLNVEGADCGYWHTEEQGNLDFHIKMAEAALKGEVAYNVSRIFKFEEICFKVDDSWQCTRKGNPRFGYIKERKKINLHEDLL